MNTYYLKKFRKRFAVVTSLSGKYRLFDFKEDRFYPNRDEHSTCVAEGLARIIGLTAITHRIKVYSRRNARKELKLAKSV